MRGSFRFRITWPEVWGSSQAELRLRVNQGAQSQTNGGLTMRRLFISAIIGVALFAAAATALRPHAASGLRAAATGAMPPVQDLQGDTSKLPVEAFEDRSLVYPNIPQR
jgi:hypothetical protein